MEARHGTRLRLTVGALAAVAAVVAAVPAASARVPIPEEPEVTIGPRISPEKVTLTPATAARELVTIWDSRSGAQLYRFKQGNRYSIPFE